MRTKNLFKIVTIGLVSITSYSQSLEIGIKGGLNYANQTGSEIRTEAITSYHAGLYTNFSLFKGVSVQPELLYTTQGATYKNALKEYKNELGYISIPLLLKIDITKSLSLELGPQAAFLLEDKDAFDPEDQNTFDFSANAGIALKLTERLGLQARYNAGLTEATKNAQIKNNVIQLSAYIQVF